MARAVTRPGFGLAEVLVAAVLLAGGMLTVAATAVAARQRMSAARTEEESVRLAAVLLDSLRGEVDMRAGATLRGGIRADWHAVGDDIILTIALPVGLGAERTRSYRIRSAAALHAELP